MNPIGTERSVSISVCFSRIAGLLGGVLAFSCPTEVLVPQVKHPETVPHEHQRLLYAHPLLAQHDVAFDEPARIRVAREHLQCFFVGGGCLNPLRSASYGVVPIHLCAPSFPKGPRLCCTRCYEARNARRGSGHPPPAYSPECVEGEFSEVRLYRDLRSSLPMSVNGA